MIALILAGQATTEDVTPLDREPGVGIAIRIRSMSCNRSDPPMQIMSLEGVEALDLYLAAIDHNIGSLNDQVALLRTALAERDELQRKCATQNNEEKDDPK
jgi:hypothetical protein